MSQEQNPVQIRVDLGYTLNTGNYEALKINIGIADQARVINGKQESAEEAFNRVYGFVESKLAEKLTEAKEDFGDDA